MALPIPLLALAPVLAVFALMDWRRLPVLARVSLAVATAFLFAGLQRPGLTAPEVSQLGTGLAILLTLAKAAGGGAVLASVVVKVRGFVRP